MILHVHTARLPHHGCPGYTGRDAIDVTRGSGGAYGGAFAPSRELLDEAQAMKRRAKKDEAKLVEAWGWYAPRYVEEMRQSYRTNRLQWAQLLARAEVTLCCYCGTWSRCHRRLLAELLVKCGAIDLGEREPATPVAGQVGAR